MPVAALLKLRLPVHRKRHDTLENTVCKRRRASRQRQAKGLLHKGFQLYSRPVAGQGSRRIRAWSTDDKKRSSVVRGRAGLKAAEKLLHRTFIGKF